MSNSVEIKVNESGDDLLKSNPAQFKATNRPPGVNFYTSSWDPASRAQVNVRHGIHSIEIKSALSATGNDDRRFPAEGIVEWSVNAGISHDGQIGHDEARRAFASVLAQLRKTGWTRVVPISRPRLKGKDALNYALKDSGYPLDPDYQLSFDEWMSLPDGSSWSFYADKTFLELTLFRDSQRRDPQKPGAYFLTYALTAENALLRGYLDEEQRQNWRQELKSELSLLRKSREQKEKQMREQHIAIDEQYRDPPVFDAY